MFAKTKIKPNLFLVGMQKCGTESLKDWLNQHPDIWMYMDREPNFFADDVQGCEDYTDFAWYKSLFPKNIKEKYIAEKSARYLHSRESAKRIKEFNPSAKILIILRNPAEMMFSSHRHLRQQGLETIEDFEEALQKEEDRKKKYGSKFIRNFFYKFTADYYSSVKRFIDEFGRENVKVVILRDVKKNPQRVYDEITNFLGIKKFKPKFRVLNEATNSPKSELYAKSFYFFQNLPTPFKRLIKAISSHSIRQKVKKIHLTDLKQRKGLDDKTKIKLNNELIVSIKRLEKLLNKDLSFWYS